MITYKQRLVLVLNVPELMPLHDKVYDDIADTYVPEDDIVDVSAQVAKLTLVKIRKMIEADRNGEDIDSDYAVEYNRFMDVLYETAIKDALEPEGIAEIDVLNNTLTVITFDSSYPGEVRMYDLYATNDEDEESSDDSDEE